MNELFGDPVPAVVVDVESEVGRWVDAVRVHLVAAVESIVAAGRRLTEAKAALPHGDFGPLLDEIGISHSMANRYMRVAANPVIVKCAPVHNLPASVSVLDELGKLDEDRLEHAIVSGEVNASTTRKDAVRIVNYARDPYVNQLGNLPSRHLAPEPIRAAVERIVGTIVEDTICNPDSKVMQADPVGGAS